METRVDSVGRIVIPKPLRDALGLVPGSKVDVSPYGAGLHLSAGGRTATIVDEDGMPVITGQTELTDEMLYSLIDAGRR